MIDKNLLLISHVADEDGITPVILAKLVYKNVTPILLNPGEVDKVYLENVDNYDLVHITDLNISEELAKQINENQNLKNKTLIFDHHQSAINLNKYDFIEVVTEENKQKQSATSLYYRYLITISDNPILKKESTKGLVNEVRIIDTYDFKTEDDKKALNLDYLFSILGRENYQTYFEEYIRNNDKFEYTKKEQFLIKLQKDKIDNYITNKSKEMMLANLEGHKVGVVYAESNRSLLGNHLVENNDIDFAIVINVSRSVSYRGKDKVDLSVFSAKHKGGGHKNASGSPLPENLLQNITKIIFSDIKFIENKEEEHE